MKKYPKWHINSEETTRDLIIHRIQTLGSANAIFNAAWQAFAYFPRNERVVKTVELLKEANRFSDQVAELIPNIE